MKFNKIIPLAAFACLIVSCGEKALPKIEDDRAIEIATEMLKRREDSTLTSLPDNFVFRDTHNEYTETKEPEEGLTKTEQFESIDLHFDIKNLRYKNILKVKATGNESLIEQYVYYDNTVGILYNMYNRNGTKTRTDESITYEQATTKFADWRTKCITSIGAKTRLNNVISNMQKKQEMHKKYEQETDQHYNYSYASANDKSLLETIDLKIKYEDGDLKGYETYYQENHFENDRLINYKYNYYQDSANDDGNTYRKLKEEYDSNITFDNASISIPNIADYKKI